MATSGTKYYLLLRILLEDNFWELTKTGFIRYLLLIEIIQILVMQPLNANMQYAKSTAAIFIWASNSIYTLFLVMHFACKMLH